MAEAGMPERGAGCVGEEGSRGGVRRDAKRVELVGAVTSEHHRPGMQILNREAKRVKFHGNKIVTSKCTNRN